MYTYFLKKIDIKQQTRKPGKSKVSYSASVQSELNLCTKCLRLNKKEDMDHYILVVIARSLIT